MKKCYSFSAMLASIFWSFLFFFTISPGAFGQSFSQNGLNFDGKGSLKNGTSLAFGPDGKLYVTEYTGSIKIFTIERVGPGNYKVLSMDELTGIQSIQDYNDDGTLYTSQFRETIGLAVTGTASNPVLYVSSSDFRIGGGGGGGSGDVGLDTNSGIITRYTWNGSSWNEVDIVRGLPRSEENHATNGIEFTTINGVDYLIVAQGGHTNAGGPSASFAYTTEYALSAAVLSINLTMLEAMPVLDDNGRKYIYDLPTLDDPTRQNKNGITDPDAPGYDGIDINDPFGGNDGLNQAIIVPGGPVQIFSPGYRNAYDLVVTEGGAVYVTDNGPNGGWGGFPVNEGGGSANNNYDPTEPGSTSSSGGEMVNNKDHLSLITLDIQNYKFGSFYGGHPTPVRANPFGAGLYTNPAVTGTNGAIFRTQIYDPNGSRTGSTTDPAKGLPANWPPVKDANPVEGDYRGPGDSNPDGPVDALVTIWGTNTNGIDEYKASNFEGAMKGNLIAGVNTGELRRVELNTDGSLKKLTPSFASGIGGDALGIACNGDNDIFPGTIWVATLNGKLVVLEPLDFVICVGPNDPKYDPNADNDSDGYTNQDEVDNGTDPCNGASQPSDFDKAAGAPLVSDLNDTDDDNDGILDSADPFQLGDPLKSGSDAFDLPVNNELFSSNPNLKGYMGLGMTGLMNNGAPNPNWLNWLDRRDDPNDPNPNDILGGAIGAMTMHMTAGTALGTSNNQEKGFQYGVKVSQATGKFTVAGGIMNLKAPLQLYGHPNTPNGELGFFIGDGTQSNYIKFVITKTGLMALQEINDVPSTPIKFSVPESSRPDAGVTFYFNVDPSNGNISLDYSFDNGPTANLGSLIAQGAVLQAIQQLSKDLAVGFIGTSNAAGVELEGTWDFLKVAGSGPMSDSPMVLYRINSGGPDIQAIDGDINWAADTGTNNSPYLSVAGNNSVSEFSMTGYSASVDQNTTPVGIFTSERYDGEAGPPNMTYAFPVSAPGNYIVRLYMGNGYEGTSSPGQRIFDVAIEGFVYPQMKGIDLSALFGHAKGGMIDQTVEVTDGVLNISFLHGVENPLINGIEILGTFQSSNPITVVQLGDQTHVAGKQLDGSLVIQASGGDGNLSYSMAGAPAGVVIEPTNGQIGGTIDTNAHLYSPYLVTIKVDDSDETTSDAVSMQFKWYITTDDPVQTSTVLYRVNTGGSTIGAIDGKIDWGADTGTNNSPYLTVAGSNNILGSSMTGYSASVDQNTTPVGIFNTERYDGEAGPPNMTYSFPVSAPGNYLVRLYIGNGWAGTSSPGQRVFDVAIEGFVHPSMNDIDLSALFGHAKGGMISQIVEVTDGVLNISFIHGVENPLINGIEILSTSQTNNPITIVQLADQTHVAGKQLDGSLVIQASGGDGNLSYSMTGAPTGIIINSSTGVISGTIDTNAHLKSPYTVTVKVDDSDETTSDAVSMQFKWYITTDDPVQTPTVLYRINTGGSTIGAIDGKIDWGADTGTNNSPYLTVAGSNNTLGSSMTGYSASVDQNTTPVGIFNTERFDGVAGPPNMTYSFPVSAPGNYIVRLYMGNGWAGTSSPGQRIFDVAIEGNISPQMKGIDLSAKFGHAKGGMIDQIVEVTDGVLNISFIHGVENPLINGIEILSSSSTTNIQVAQIPNQSNNEGAVLDGSLKATATGGDGALVYKISGAPAGVVINSSTGVISGTIGSNTASGSPYQVTVTVDDSDGETTDAVSTQFTWTILSTTTQTPIAVTQIPNQSNNEGAVLDGSLKATATGGDGALVYKISGAPAGVVINLSTGVISGTIGSNTASGSPYQVTVTVDDSDGETSDSVSTIFTWTVLEKEPDPIPIAVTQIPNQSNNEGAVLDGSLKATATGGDGALVYEISGAPAGVVINSSTGVISGTIGSNTASGSPYQVTVTVDDSDGETTDAVSTQFTWTILSTTTQTPIAVTQIPNQSNYSGDVLNGSLIVNATGGDGALKYSISNAPLGVVINATNGVISGTISQDAHLLSPYNVSVTVDDSDAFTNDAVTVNFSWKVDQAQVAYQGCTAEFWAGSSGWCSTYKPTDSFFTVFGITNKRGLGGKTGVLSLNDALAQKGGGYNKLAKQATAALLNACSSAVNYQYPETQIIAEVKDAFNNTAYNNSYANTLSSKYENANIAGCPADQKSAIASKSSEMTFENSSTTVYPEEPEVEETIIIKMYPNPANAEVYLQPSNPSVKITGVAMYDYNGRYIRTFSTGQELLFDGNERYMFNISGMPNGVYILKISTESSGMYTLRLVKED